MIPYGRQTILQADIDAVSAVLKSDFLTQGPVVPEFEADIARYCCVSQAVAINSATSALHVACLALGVGPGDWVWTCPNTFVASANCARYCGAHVDFVDIDPLTYNISVSMLSAKLAAAAKQGCLPKVVIPVHFSGEPCDMAAIAELSREYGFSVIEDAAHAIGARYRDHVVGDCKYSDITVFSFHPVKIITTAEGGVATTNSAKLAQSMARLRTHGITRSPTEMTKTPDGPWYYEQIELGFNYRMTEMQAALGRSQLVHLDEWVGKRQLIAEKYDLGLASTPLTLPFRAESNRSALHLYVVLVPDPTGAQRARVFQDLRNAGIGVNVHYIPVHLQPDFARLGFVAGAFPESELYYRRALSLPMFSGLSADDQNTVIAAVRQALL